jgi:hypothetical protein
VEAQPHRSIGSVGTHGSVGEGRIADGEVELGRQIAAGKIGVDDAGPRLQQPDDTGCHGIEFHAGDIDNVPQGFRHQCREQACADARLQHPAPAPAEPLQTGPDGPDDVFRREMRILRTARERGIFSPGDGLFEVDADLVPVVTEVVLTGSTEDGIGMVRGAETGEADQLRLFVWRSWSIRRLNLGRQAKGC